MNFLREILQNILKSNKLNKAWRWTATFLAAVVVFVTTYSLILPAITMESTTAESMPGFSMEGQTEITQRAEEELLSSEPVETYEDGSGIQTAAEPESVPAVLPNNPEGGTASDGNTESEGEADSADDAESEVGTDPADNADSDDETDAGTDSSDSTEEELISSDASETNSTPEEENIPQTESLTAKTENVEAVVSYVSGALFSSKFNLSLKELKKDAEKYNVYRKIAQSKASTDPDDPGDWFGCDARIFAFDFTDEEGNGVAPSEEVWAEIRLQEPMKADLCKIVLLTDDQDEVSGEAGETDYNNIKARNNNTLQIKRNEDNMIVGLRFKAKELQLAALLMKDAEADEEAETQPGEVETDAAEVNTQPETTDPTDTNVENEIVPEESDNESKEEQDVKSEDERGEEQTADPEADPDENLALLYPAQEFEAHSGTVKVLVKADIGAFPAETTMKVEDVDSKETLAAIEGAVDQNISRVDAVEITFYDAEGIEIEPRIPVHVIMTAEKFTSSEEVKVVHVDNEGVAAEVEDVHLVEHNGKVQAQVVEEGTGEAPGENTAENPAENLDRESGANTEADSDETFIDNQEADSVETNTDDPELVSFDAEEFSIYALVYIVEFQFEKGGETYKITVTYGADAGIPEGAGLEVREILQETEAVDGATEYEKYIAKTQEALGLETSVFPYARIFDIKIVDENGGKVTITAPVDVKIELADKDGSEEASASTQVVHFADGSETGEVVEEVTDEGNSVSFEAEGFSAYAIVTGPEAVPMDYHKVASIEELISKGSTEGLYIGHPDGYYYGNTLDNSNKRTGIVKTKPAQAYPPSGAAKYYFEPVEGTDNKVYAYCYASDGTTKQYVYNGGNNSLSFTTAENKTAFTVSVDSSGRFKLNNGSWYWNMQGGASGNRFCSWNNANDVNNNVYFWYRNSSSENDPYDLDGTTYGLMNWNGGVAGKALMAKNKGNALEAKPLTVMRTSDNSDQLFVPNDSDISMWTFHWVEEDKYYLTTVVDGSTKYLQINGDGLSLVSEPDDRCKIQVIPGTGAHAGEICLKSGNTTLTYSGLAENGFSVGGSAGREWLNLVELSELTTDYFRTYSASKVSVSNEAITNGSRVIVYTRSWNDEKKQYDYYAISSDGTLVPVYESGDSIEWVSGQLNTLLWNFVEHYWEGTTDPNFYYELYNQYSEKYIAPQVADGQILSEDPIGINLNGRRDGKYYSTIMAWDEANYSYAGLKVENGQIVSCPKSEAMDFYFAIMQDLNVDDSLHTVPTVDNTQYGITMKLIDLENNKTMTGDMNKFMGSDAGGVGTALVQGLLSTNLESNGYPTAAGGNLSGLYKDAQEVNHLFIESIYNATGYFEYDSTQNFASLNNGNNFTVYKELGTYDGSTLSTRKHGQFFPFNDLQAGTFASVNGKNLYSLYGPLPESDPRKYENLYNLENNGKKADCYFGMELEASFTQTPSGLDAWGHDIIFEFTGDDDFWLYVDGELMIDLGGIHSAVPGNVNFRTGEVNVNGRRTTLRDLFYNNYIGRGHTEAQAQAYVDEKFEQNSDGQWVFKDYTNHTMRIFYMERGAGASNLQMRFNLAAVKKGTVQLNKQLSGIDNMDSVMADFPYQILYKTSEAEGAEEKYLQNSIAASPTQNEDYVFYKDSINPVKYRPSVEIGGVTYKDVFFLKPGETADISFPEGMTSYRIVECGVNTEVYNTVTVNGTEVDGTAVPGSSNHYKDFGIGYASTDERARVNYVNGVNPEALRTLTIRKKLYDETGETEIDYEQDQTLFKFRLYLASEYDELDAANMYTYHVKDPYGYYCMWNTAQKKFVRIGDGISDYSLLSAEQKNSANFVTSVYGQITQIPVGYTVELRDVLAGTKYRVEERKSEIPDGYAFRQYEDFDEQNAAVEDLSGISGVNGTVVSRTDPTVTVGNLKGWGLRMNKIWSDEDYMSNREPTYFAVFIKENDNNGEGNGDGHITLVDGTVRQLTFDEKPQSLYWYFDRLRSGTSFDHYLIREVRLTGSYEVQDDGTVTGADHSEVHSIHQEAQVELTGRQKGETSGSKFTYTVLYEPGTITTGSNVRVDTVTNNRPGIVLKKSKWDGTSPLEGAVFTLKDEEGNLIGTFTSDETGWITTAFLRDNVPYTLTETNAPQGWYGLQEPMTITLNNKIITVTGADKSMYIVDNSTATPTLTVKDRPYIFRAVKKDGDTKEPMAGVIFALHKQTTVDNVTAIDLNPMLGYESLVTDPDGVIPRIDHTLPAGTYELREKETLNGYQLLSGYIRFTVSSTGAVSLVEGNYPAGVSLSGQAESGDESGTFSYELSVLNHSFVTVTLHKVDKNKQDLTGAKFRLCKYDTSWETVDGFDEIDMTDSSTVTFNNLAVGLYSLTEMKAPDGYVILDNDVYFNIGFDASGKVKVTLTDAAGTGPNTNSSASADGTTITVENTPGAALPNTGGPGTRPFRILGLILIAGAGVLLWRRKRLCL